MADSKITALTALTAADPANDMIPIVDVSDTPPASGNTKRISINNILACSPSATLASLNVTGSSMPANGLYLPTTNTLEFSANTLAQYRIAPLGVFSWYDGAGGTRMTLNATGLGVGVASPAQKVDVAGSIQATADVRIKKTGSDTFASGPFVYLNSGDGGGNGSALQLNATNGLDIWNSTGGVWSRRMTVDIAGNVGIGVTPSAWGSGRAIEVLEKGYGIWNGTGSSYLLANAYFNSGFKYANTGSQATHYYQYQGTHVWSTAASGTAGNAITFTQAMTLDASGNLLVGKTSTTATVGGGVVYLGRLDSARDTGNAATFNHTTAGNLVGNIAITSTATTYNSASDYRLKEAIQPLSGGLARVSALKPSIYKWKVDGSSGEGFLAHELADVVPLAVTGEKDAVNPDGKPEYQGVDLSKVVPILVAAIQELTAEVNALKNA